MAPTNLPAYNPFRPLVTGWLNKIDAAKQHKKHWQEVADECMQFFCASAGFMWEDKYKHKLWDRKATPRFRMTMAKAFELVALFGPLLYWRNPVRTIHPKRPIVLPPELFGDPADPMFQMSMEFAMYQEQLAMANQEKVQLDLIAELLSRWLNYTPGEMPGGGLKAHAQLAITEALIKGRGTLWTEQYQMPGSQRVLTGSFYDTADNLFIDPDATTLEDAWWIARKCTHPTWEVERKYGLPEGSLEGKGNIESAWSVGERSSPADKMERQGGKTFDMITYYKIWSKGGAGGRLAGVTSPLKSILDQLVGDYAYIVVCDSCPYPLNANPDALMSQPPEAVAQAFSWPIPYWKDDRWPVSVLDFYQKPNSVWPVAPLSPGLGELKFLNIMISHLCNRIVSSSRDFWAVAKSFAKEAEQIIAGGLDQCVIPVPEQAVHAAGGKLANVMAVLQQPQTNLDVWKIIEAVSENFDKRVGMSELLYGLNPGAASRTAEDASMKRSSLSVRPDWMASCVEDWMTDCAKLEHFCAVFFTEPTDTLDLLGQAGAQLWQQLIMSRDIETVLRETQCTIEAGSARKPNKDRDVANLNAALPIFLPLLQQYAMTSGNTQPLNTLLERWGEANDMDVQDMLIPNWIPMMMPGQEPGGENQDGAENPEGQQNQAA